MLDALNNYDWEEVFKYAQPKVCEAGHEHGPKNPRFTKAVSTTSFTRDDVKEIIALENGENDGPEWIAVLRLNDGRYAVIRAGCDYTGWG